MTDDNARDPGPTSETGDQDRSPDKSVALQAENADLRDRMLRALADAENTRRRAERTAQEARRYGIADFARELLPVADNLERTLTAAEPGTSPQQNGDAALREGVVATQRVLEHALAQFGVRKIDARGAPFNPSLHEALMEVPDPSQPPGIVLDVMEDGFTIHDRLLRPARVVVAQRTRGPSSSEGNTGNETDPQSRNAPP